MKLHVILAVFLTCAAGICSGNEIVLDIQAIKQPAIDSLTEHKEAILLRERLIAESEYGELKAKTYMAYFEKGMASETGIILLEGDQSRWLEAAHLRGHSFRQAFIAGYLSGRSSDYKYSR